MSTFVIFVCRAGKGVIYTRVSRHIISSHRNIFRVIRKDGDRWWECGEKARVIPVSQSPEPGWWENIPRLRDGWWGGGTGRCRVTAGCCLTWSLTTSVGTRHRSREHPRDRENVTRDTQTERERDKWDYKDKVEHSDHKKTHGVKVSHNNMSCSLSIPGIQFFRTIQMSKCTSYKTVTTAALWGSFSQLM